MFLIDVQKFLKENDLQLILRSHEGPDAREEREGMGNMLEGYSIDHTTESGRLMTVFSAPDYPQFIAEQANRYQNKAAIAVLSSPNWSNPEMRQYEAVLPRPEATPYYDLGVPDSDEEYEPAASDLSGMTDVKAERLAAAKDDAVAGGEDEGAVESEPVQKRRHKEKATSPSAVVGAASEGGDNAASEQQQQQVVEENGAAEKQPTPSPAVAAEPVSNGTTHPPSPSPVKKGGDVEKAAAPPVEKIAPQPASPKSPKSPKHHRAAVPARFPARK